MNKFKKWLKTAGLSYPGFAEAVNAKVRAAGIEARIEAGAVAHWAAGRRAPSPNAAALIRARFPDCPLVRG